MDIRDIFEQLNAGLNGVGMYEVRFDIYQGTQLIESTTQTLPEAFAKQNFIGIIQQLANANVPMKAEMHVKYDIFDDNDKYVKTLDNYIEYKNNLYDK